MSVTSGALPSNSWIVPADVTASNFAWQTFVALNWPSAVPATTSGILGLANTQLARGASSSNQAMIPTVWLTFEAKPILCLRERQILALGRPTHCRFRRRVRR